MVLEKNYITASLGWDGQKKYSWIGLNGIVVRRIKCKQKCAFFALEVHFKSLSSNVYTACDIPAKQMKLWSIGEYSLFICNRTEVTV
jgi:hypothetical protein